MRTKMQLFHEPSTILRMVTSQETRSLNFFNVSNINIAENDFLQVEHRQQCYSRCFGGSFSTVSNNFRRWATIAIGPTMWCFRCIARVYKKTNAWCNTFGRIRLWISPSIVSYILIVLTLLSCQVLITVNGCLKDPERTPLSPGKTK